MSKLSKGIISWSLVMFMVLSMVLPASASDVMFDRFQNKAASDNYGLSYSDSDDGLYLAWREAPAIESYLQAFETYRDTYWLDKSVEHIDNVISNAYDFENDGYSGWYSSLESTQHMVNPSFDADGPGPGSIDLIENSGFESAADGNELLPDGWQRENGSETQIYRTTQPGTSFSGNSCIVAKYNGQSAPARLSKQINYVPGVLYTVSYVTKTNSRKTAAKVEIVNRNTSTAIVQSPTFGNESIYMDDWVRGSFNFRAPTSEGVPLYIKIGLMGEHQQPDWEVYFDEISIKPVETYENKIQNPGFEISATSDANLPDKWTRAGASTLVKRTETTESRFSGNSGITIPSNGTTWQTLYQNISYQPNETYTVSFWAKTNSNSAKGMVDIYDVNTNTYIVSKTFAGTEWQQYSLTFNAPATYGHTMRMELRQSAYTNADWIVYYDDIVLKSQEVFEFNKISNSSMELGAAADSTLPTGWVRVGSPSLVYRSDLATEKYSGNYGLVVKSDGQNVQMLKQNITYVPNKRYILTFYGKTSEANVNLKAQIYDETTNKVLAWKPVTGVTEWGKNTVVFTSPEEGGHNLTIQLAPTTPVLSSWIVYFDDVELKLYDEGLVFNTGFETVSVADSTMAMGWERFQSTSTNAMISTNINEYYSGSKGMKIVSDTSQIPMVQAKLEYNPGAKYTAIFDSINNKGDALGMVEVYDATANQVLASMSFSNTSWVTSAIDFTAPVNVGNNVYLRLRQTQTTIDNWVTCFDNVKVLPALKRSAREWSRVNMNSENAYVSSKSGESRTGPYGLAIKNNGAINSYVEQQIMAYAPNKPYSVYYYGKVNYAGASGKVTVYDETDSVVLAEQSFNNTKWPESYLILNFQTPPSGHVIKVRLTQTGTSSFDNTAFFDDICVGERCLNFVNQAMIIKPILLFSKVIGQNPDIQQQYQAKAQQYLSFIQNNVYPQFESMYRDIDAERGMYVFNYDNAARWMPDRSAPHNQYLRMAECAFLLYDITGGTEHLTRATKLLNSFKSKLIQSNYATTAYQWNYWDKFGSWDENFWYNSNLEDTSHGNLDISAAIIAYKHDVVFDLTDMQKFISTFKDVMWNGSLSNPVLASLVDRKGGTTSDLIKYTICTDDWVNLALFDSQIYDICKAIMENVGSRVLPAINMAALNPEYGVNGNFELAGYNNAAMPLKWSANNITAGNAYIDRVNYYSGKAGLSIKSDGVNSPGYVEQRLEGYTPNSDYELKFMANTQTNDYSGTVEIYNATTNTILTSRTTDTQGWKEYSAVYTTPAQAQNELYIRIYVNSGIAEKVVNFDNLRVYANNWNSFVPNGNFEIADKIAESLPAYWEPSSATSVQNVYISSNDAFKGEKALIVKTDSVLSEQKIGYRINSFEPQKTYDVKFAGKTNIALTGGKVFIYNETTSQILASRTIESTQWSWYEMSFMAPADYTDVLKIYVANSDVSTPDAELYIDELGVTLSK